MNLKVIQTLEWAADAAHVLLNFFFGNKTKSN